MSNKAINELPPDAALKFLTDLVQHVALGKEKASLERLRVLEGNLRTVMHEAAEELRGVQREIMVRLANDQGAHP